MIQLWPIGLTTWIPCVCKWLLLYFCCIFWRSFRAAECWNSLLLATLLYANQLSHHQVHGLLHLLGFDHELGKEAEEEMEKEEEHILNTLEWKGKGLIRSAYHFSTDMDHSENSDGRLPLHVLLCGFLCWKDCYLFLLTGVPLNYMQRPIEI